MGKPDADVLVGKGFLMKFCCNPTFPRSVLVVLPDNRDGVMRDRVDFTCSFESCWAAISCDTRQCTAHVYLVLSCCGCLLVAIG